MTRTRPVRRTTCRVVVSVLLIVAVGSARPAAGATAAEVDNAIAKAKAYLYTKQLPNGTWDESVIPPKVVPPAAPGAAAPAVNTKQSIATGQWTGPTALATYALLAAGEDPKAPKLAKAIEFLKKSSTSGVYALGLRCQVWLLLEQSPEVKACMRRDAAILINSMKLNGSAKGMYDYIPSGPGGPYSHSRAQYGVLGVWAAEQAAVMDVPDKYWVDVERAWIEHQDPTGGWAYLKAGDTNNQPVTPGMTAVGVATLFITQDYVHAGDGILCKGNATNDAIEKGLKWMADNMDKVASDNRYARDFPYMTLFAVQRIGTASGIKYFKDVDWYQKGATWLLAKQGADGSWAGEGTSGGVAQVASLGETSFAMLFLARARGAVVFNKLDYSRGVAGPTAAPWSQRGRDVANVTRWIGRTVERDLNWQVVPITAPLGDLLDAPILYVSGNQALEFTEPEQLKLRQFVEMGGLIVGNADCGAAAFSDSFQKLGRKLFPAYEFRELPDNHQMYNGVFPRSKWKVKPSVLGISNGARELMILIPQADPARWWQTRTVGGKEEMFQLAGAILFYSQSDRDLRYRGDWNWVAADPNVAATRTLKVYRLQYPGNWDPEPAGWLRVGNVLHNQCKLDLSVEPVKLGEGKLPPTTRPAAVAHLTGTAKFTLNDVARNEIKKFVAGGGTLIVDAAGGSTAFADSAEAELAAMFGGAPTSFGEILPPDDAAYGPIGGKVPSIEYRPFTRGKISGQLNAPRVRGLEEGGRVRVFYSREDLSAGIVGQHTDGIFGYSPQTATYLMASILFHVAPKDPTAAQPTWPTTKPATIWPTTRPATQPAAKPRATTTAS